MNTLILDPGHGPGETHRRGGLLFCEGDANYALAREIKRQAGERHIPVRLTRTENEDPTLQERARMGGEDTLFLSLHSNAGPPHRRGTEIYDSLRSPDKALAEHLGRTIAETLGTPWNGVRYRRYSNENEWKVTNHPVPAPDYYGVLRHNGAPVAMLVEIGYHTNRDDSLAILKNRTALAKAILDVVEPRLAKRLYTVQAGAFVNRDNAEKMKARLKSLGIDAYITVKISSEA